MLNFIEKNTSSVINTERSVYALNGKGFMIKCGLMVKIVPRLSNGIEIVALFSENFDDHNSEKIMVDVKDGKIVGVTERCYVKFGLHPSICYDAAGFKTPLNISQIMPKINSINDVKDGEAELGDLILDTTIIRADHYIQKNELGRIGLPLHGWSAFKKYNVKIEIENHHIANKGPELVIISLSEYQITTKKLNSIVSVNNDQDIEYRGRLERVLDSYALFGIQNIKTTHSKPMSVSIHNDTSVMHEHEIEEANLAAEKERKLKETKLSLASTKMPFHIVLMYVTSSIGLMLGFALILAAYLLHDDLSDTFSNTLNAFNELELRKTEITRISYFAMKLRDAFR
jgi:hypothetical protein